MSKKYSAITGLIALVLLLTFFSGCKSTPDKEIVVSKSDGSFEQKILQTPAESNSDIHNSILLSGDFSSSDGSVVFSSNIAQQIDKAMNPVVEVTPHYLTGADAERVATALFGDVSFYEQQPLLETPNYSQAQIQERIDRWAKYTSTEALQELYGTAQGDLEWLAGVVQNFIGQYTGLLVNAPAKIERHPCTWELKNDAYYYYKDISAVKASDYNDAIKATVKVGAVEYTFEASTRNQSDFKINSICAKLYSGICPNDIDTRIYRAMLCRTGKPNDTDIQRAVEKAQGILSKMELGQWVIDESTVQIIDYGSAAEYSIRINAVPVFENMAALRVPQLETLKSNDSFASHYYLTNASFEFSANGDLVSFELTSPVDVKTVLNQNVQTMDLDALVERATDHLSLSDKYAYGVDEDYLKAMEQSVGEAFICNIDICKIDWGLLRTKVANTEDSYYYIPCLMLSGTVDYSGEKTGNTYLSSGTDIFYNRIIPLVALNAVDGSVIDIGK